MDVKEEQRSEMYGELQEKFERNYITVKTLRGWVALNAKKPEKGITPQEFEEMTGEVYA